jgi:hypothetical protein
MGYLEAWNRGHTKLVIPCLRLCPITYVENIEQCLSIIGINSQYMSWRAAIITMVSRQPNCWKISTRITAGRAPNFPFFHN